MGDEIEARWNKFLLRNPYMSTLEVMWGKVWPGSFDIAAQKIAAAIGVEAPVAFEDQWKKGHEHAGSADEVGVKSTHYALQDRFYKKAMRYKYAPA